jgi:hypothetical protein
MTFERIPEVDLFIVLAHEVLRAEKPKGGERYEKVHTVWSGFNTAFRKLFPGLDPVKYVNGLAENGLVQISPARGGAFLKPYQKFSCEVQKGQEELGMKILRFLEDFSARNQPATVKWKPGDTAKFLKDMGY